MRCGKLNLPTESDLAVKWILDSYKELQNLRQNIVLIPLSINYDRIFEMDNLANEIISGENQDLRNIDVAARLNSIVKGSLGNTYIRFGEQIMLHDYLSSKKGIFDCPNKFEYTAKKLSVKLTK